MKVARIYLRVSTHEQDLTRQEAITQRAKEAGFYIAGVYREYASGAIENRPELQRLIHDLQKDDVVIAEKLDRITRLPLPQAEKLINSIKDKGARLSVPDLVDFSEFSSDLSSTSITKIVMDSVQEMLLKIALQCSRDEYETRRYRQKQGIALAKKTEGKYVGRPIGLSNYKLIIDYRLAKKSIHETAASVKCSITHVKDVFAKYKKVIGLKTEGLTQQEIAKQTKYPLDVIKLCLTIYQQQLST